VRARVWRLLAGFTAAAGANFTYHPHRARDALGGAVASSIESWAALNQTASGPSPLASASHRGCNPVPRNAPSRRGRHRLLWRAHLVSRKGAAKMIVELTRAVARAHSVHRALALLARVPETSCSSCHAPAGRSSWRERCAQRQCFVTADQSRPIRSGAHRALRTTTEIAVRGRARASCHAPSCVSRAVLQSRSRMRPHTFIGSRYTFSSSNRCWSPDIGRWSTPRQRLAAGGFQVA